MRRKMFFLAVLMLVIPFCMACGSKEESAEGPEGSLDDILTEIYGSAALSDDFRESLEHYETLPLNDDIEVSVLGTDEIAYTEGLVSMPMMSSVAFQCVLLRVPPEDAETVKQQITDNADLNKWVCVSAETMLVESRGDVILFVMGDQDTVYALNAAFQDM